MDEKVTMTTTQYQNQFKRFSLFVCVLAMSWMLSACGDDAPVVTPDAEAVGTFVDPRDGEQYGWVRYGGLDWMTENFRYDIQDAINSTIYIDADEHESNRTSTRNLARYGRLYTLDGAVKAQPEGWRLPTDSDWQQLEQSLGMTAGEVARDGWRGSIARSMLSVYDEQSPLNLLLGGYYFANTPGVQSGWRHMGTYGYYWTSTADDSKEGEFYYVRRLTYASDAVSRISMEPTGYKLSVRYVRNAR